MKRGRYLGKLRSNFARTRHFMYARGPGGSVDKREAGCVVFDKPGLSALGRAKEPRRMTVVLPSVDARTRTPHAMRVARRTFAERSRRALNLLHFTAVAWDLTAAA